MRDRIGVIRHGSAADGSRQLILPSGEITVVGHDLADADIAERFGLDVVRYADALDWGRSACRDGPMAGAFAYSANRVGSKVSIALTRPGGAMVEYEVTQLGTDASPAELRLSQS